MKRTLNHLAKMVIGLHEEGYYYDFELYGEIQLWGVQENRPYVFEEININKVCPIMGPCRNGAKFILAIETTDGCKGLLVGIDLGEAFFELSRRNGNREAKQLFHNAASGI
jgi:hypothetical protein